MKTRMERIRSIGSAFVLIVLLPLAAWTDTSTSAAGAQGEAPSVDSLVAEAVRKNPAWQAAQHRHKAAEAGVRRAGAYAPPQLGVERGERQGAGTHGGLESMPMTGISASQMIMFPGKVAAMKRAETHRAAMVGNEAEAIRQGIVRQVRDVYFDLYMLQRQRDINADNRRIMEKFVAVARNQYEVGMGRMEDILRAQTELSRLRSDDLVLIQKYRSMEAMLNALLDRPPQIAYGRIAEPNPAGSLPASEALVALALQHRPDLEAMRQDVGMNRWELKAARREAWPDFMVEGRWMVMDGPDEWAVMAGVTLPFAPWSAGKVTGAREQAKARLREVEAEEKNMANMVAAQVHAALAQVEAAREMADLAVTTTIPQSEQTLQSTESAYRAGKTEFLMVLDAYRMLFMAREDAYMAKAKLHQGLAALENAVGMPLDGLSSSDNAGPKSKEKGSQKNGSQIESTLKEDFKKEESSGDRK